MVGDRPLLDARGLTKALRRCPGAERGRPDRSPRGGARAPRGERLRQVDADQDPGGLPHPGRGRALRQRPGGAAAAGARRAPAARHGVRAPGPRPGGVADGGREPLHGRHREAVEPLLRVLVAGAPRRPARSSPATASRSTRTPPSTGSARWSGRSSPSCGPWKGCAGAAATSRPCWCSTSPRSSSRRTRWRCCSTSSGRSPRAGRACCSCRTTWPRCGRSPTA